MSSNGDSLGLGLMFHPRGDHVNLPLKNIRFSYRHHNLLGCVEDDDDNASDAASDVHSSQPQQDDQPLHACNPGQFEDAVTADQFDDAEEEDEGTYVEETTSHHHEAHEAAKKPYNHKEGRLDRTATLPYSEAAMLSSREQNKRKAPPPMGNADHHRYDDVDSNGSSDSDSQQVISSPLISSFVSRNTKPMKKRSIKKLPTHLPNGTTIPSDTSSNAFATSMSTVTKVAHRQQVRTGQNPQARTGQHPQAKGAPYSHKWHQWQEMISPTHLPSVMKTQPQKMKSPTPLPLPSIMKTQPQVLKGHYDRNTVPRGPQSMKSPTSDTSKQLFDTLQDVDIVCGRGRGYITHHGNVEFKRIVQTNLPIYMNAPSKSEKIQIVKWIVTEIRSSGARFVNKDMDTGKWYDIGEVKSHEKTGHAIRDFIKSMERRMEEEKIKEKEKEREAKKATRAAKKQAKLAKFHLGGVGGNDGLPQYDMASQSMLPDSTYSGGMAVHDTAISRQDASFAQRSLPTGNPINSNSINSNDSYGREAVDVPSQKVKSDDVSLFMSSIMQMQRY